MMLMPANLRRFGCFYPCFANASPHLRVCGWIVAMWRCTSMSSFLFTVTGSLYGVIFPEPSLDSHSTCNPILNLRIFYLSTAGQRNDSSTLHIPSKPDIYCICLYLSLWPIPPLKTILRSQLLLNRHQWGLRKLNPARMLHTVASCWYLILLMTPEIPWYVCIFIHHLLPVNITALCTYSGDTLQPTPLTL